MTHLTRAAALTLSLTLATGCGRPPLSGAGGIAVSNDDRTTSSHQRPLAHPVQPTCAPRETARAHYRTAAVDGVQIFFREAGPPEAPVVVLLHGFPASSHMFRNLIPVLAERYHVVAPDYPGFGGSETPDRASFTYSFERFAELVDALLVQLQATRYSLYVQDYGAPVGYRLALRHPERIATLVVQNGNAYEEGLREFWAPIKAYWADRSRTRRDALRAGLTLEATRSQYLGGVHDPTRIAPDTWLVDQALLDRPGVDEIMLDLFRNYGENIALYPRFQAFFRARRPATLIVLGQERRHLPRGGRAGVPA